MCFYKTDGRLFSSDPLQAQPILGSYPQYVESNYALRCSVSCHTKNRQVRRYRAQVLATIQGSIFIRVVQQAQRPYMITEYTRSAAAVELPLSEKTRHIFKLLNKLRRSQHWNLPVMKTENVNFSMPTIGSIGTPDSHHFGFTPNFDAFRHPRQYQARRRCDLDLFMRSGLQFRYISLHSCWIRDLIPFRREEIPICEFVVPVIMSYFASPAAD